MKNKSVGCAAVVVLLAISLSACAFLEKPKALIPTKTLAPQVATAAPRTVIVLPGQGDKISNLEKSGIGNVIQQHLPNAEIVFAEATLLYYMEGKLAQRIHEQYVQPARARGVKEIYLAGASMGGAGVLLYEREHPGELQGLVLMAPYMGEASLVQEVKAAGGLKNWQAGAVPSQLDRATFTREEWRTAQSWLTNPKRAHTVWLICGDRDKFHEAAESIAETLPREHYFVPDGGHAWTVWVQGADRAFAQIAANSISQK